MNINLFPLTHRITLGCIVLVTDETVYIQPRKIYADGFCSKEL